ncbi:S9 family peptidase [Chloroflexia bacterium SDU3-3]|nr:S9 family peptidase [Chloroflexia bacterium SDU3-3]
MRTATPEDVLAFSSLTDVSITPDGALITFTRCEPFKEYQGFVKRQIWAVPTSGGEPRPYTSGTRSDSSPTWSPDGRTLAFLSDRDGGLAQVYLLPRAGGEARRLVQTAGCIHEIAWSPDGTKIGILMSDPEPADALERRRRGDDAAEFEQAHAWWRVWSADVASGELRQLTTGDVQIWEFGWAPDGGLALLTAAEPYEWSWFATSVAYVGPDGGVPRTIYQVPEKCFAMPRVTPDGACVAVLSGIWSDRGMNAGDLLLIPIGGGAPRNLTEGYPGSLWWYQFSPDMARVDYMAYERGEGAVGQIDLAAGTGPVARARGEFAISESYLSRYIADDGTVALVRSDATTPQEVWTLDAAGEWRKLTALHAELAAELAVGEQRTVRWRSADGLEIQGILILPVGYQPGKPVPMVTWVHGGPAWLYLHNYYVANRALQLFAGDGYAVFLPNPRGSNGWGVEFLELNIGDFGGKDYEDIISGIDELVAEGIADPDRLGIGGWSYGGYMTAWAITQTTRFKAAMVGAAITNWRSFHGGAHIGLWDRVSLRANPYEQGGVFDTRAPITFVERVTTPTLIQHGELDRIVPVDQGYEFFRALKDRGVPVEMVTYPRTGHGVIERYHQLDRMRRWVELFRQYLGEA